MQITFIRHGETTGNTTHVWQGQGDSPLSPQGRRQAADLGARPSMAGFDLVVSSDLGRVLETARLAGLDPAPDPIWREMGIGSWEGFTRSELEERFPAGVAALRRGEDVPAHGGETWTEFGERVDAAVASLIDRCDPDDRVAVVTHGGVIHSVIAGHLGLRSRLRPWPIDSLRNTSLTTFEFGDSPCVRVFNDATHTRTATHPDAAGPVVALIRHGETDANLEGRWHGVTDGPLSDHGVEQAAALATRYDGVAHVYTSHLMRAMETGRALAEATGVSRTVRGDLHEIDFGAWEDMTPREIRERFPEEWQAIFVEDRDVPRGGTGETMDGVGRRIGKAVEEIAAAHPGTRVAAVSHGGAIRAYAAGIVGLEFTNRSHLALPGNTEVTHVRVAAHGPVLSAYNLRPGA